MKIRENINLSQADILNSSIKENCKLVSKKYNRKIVFIPLFGKIKMPSGKIRNRYIFDMFTNPKNQDKNTKTKNINATIHTYKNQKIQLTALYRKKDFYFNVLKYILFKYQPELTTTEQKISILEKYATTLKYKPINQNNLQGILNRELYIADLLKEIQKIKDTNEVTINL